MHIVNNPFNEEQQLSDQDIAYFQQWAEFITPNCKTPWADVWNSIKDHCSSEQWSAIWSSCDSFIRKPLRDSMTYIEWCHDGEYNYQAVIAGYIASLFPLISNAKFMPVAKLWDRGFVPCWDGKIWTLLSGPNASVRYRITMERA